MNLIPKDKVDPWYWGYAFQGAVVLGTAPILIPIIVAKYGGAAHAGAVVASFYLGQLTAPFWGRLADKTGLHKALFLSGFILLGLGLGLFVIGKLLWIWLALGFVQGAGAAVSNTVAGMNIVEFRPKEEWEGRIGWLQTLYGTGQTLGLGLAAILQKWPEAGMIVSAALMAPGILLGIKGAPQGKPKAKQGEKPLNHRKLRPNLGFMGMLHHYHRPTLATLSHFLQPWKSTFGLYLAGWFVVMFGTWLVYNLYPLVMKDVYGIGAGLSSLYYAVGAFLGIFFYALSGSLGKKIGDINVYLVGIIASLISMGSMSLLIFIETNLTWLLAPLSFIIMPIAWSPLIVAGMALTAELSPVEQGEAMGIFNASSAIASVLSALAAGVLASQFGYQVIIPTAFVVTIIGMFLTLRLKGLTVKDEGN